jgi:hypothetical protein
MNLKPEELVKVLLYCGNGGSCDVCCRPNPGEHREFERRCLGPLLLHTASQIERDQKEIDELRKELEQERRWRQTAQQWRDRDCGRCRLMLGCEYFKYAGVRKDQELEPWMQTMILKKDCRKNQMKPNAAGAAK